MYDQTNKSLYYKQSMHRFLKMYMASTETLDKNKKTLILVFRCWHYKKQTDKVCGNHFEVMNKMFIFNCFCI